MKAYNDIEVGEFKKAPGWKPVPPTGASAKVGRYHGGFAVENGDRVEICASFDEAVSHIARMLGLCLPAGYSLAVQDSLGRSLNGLDIDQQH